MNNDDPLIKQRVSKDVDDNDRWPDTLFRIIPTGTLGRYIDEHDERPISPGSPTSPVFSSLVPVAISSTTETIASPTLNNKRRFQIGIGNGLFRRKSKAPTKELSPRDQPDSPKDNLDSAKLSLSSDGSETSLSPKYINTKQTQLTRVSSESLITPRSSRSKTTDPQIAETLIKHHREQWRDLKTGMSPRNKIITNFEIGQSIGKGGSGARIYECRLDDGGLYAVKHLKTIDMVQADIDKIRIEREIMEQLPFHRNLIYYKGHLELDTDMYIFMSLHNSSLYDHLKKMDKDGLFISLKDIIKYSIDILTGIIILHGCSIIHRDIKSANIFVNYGSNNNINYLTLGDLDSAKKIITPDGTKTCIGTPLWTAPEIYGFGELKEISYKFEADIWSFGMVLYELMSCKMPFFEIKGPMAHLYKILDGDLPSLTDEQKNRYEPILKYWKECLTIDPTKRPTANDLITVFKKMLQELDNP